MHSRALKSRYPGWALVTGASAGIGEAFARYLAKHGIPSILVARRRDRLEALAATLLGSYGVTCEVMVQDLAAPDAVPQLLEKIGAREVGILVNNAGFGLHGEFCTQSPREIAQMMHVNMTVPALLARHFGEKMRERRRGAMIFLGSVVAYEAFPLIALYSASKSFDLLMGEALYAELKPFGVDVIAVSPGTTATEFHGIAQMKAGGSMNRPRNPMHVVETTFKYLGKRPSVVDGFKNYLAMKSLTIVPRRWRPAILKKAMQGQAI